MGVAALASGPALAAGTITIAGNGGAIGAARLLAEAFRAADPSITFRFLPSLGTSGGIAAATQGAIDVALAARPLTPQETAGGLVATAYGVTPVAFAVHGDSAVRDVSLAEVAAILSGAKLAWADGSAIRPIRRPHSDAASLTVGGLSPELAAAMAAFQRRPGLVTAANDQENADTLESVRGAFGAITLAQSMTERRRLHLLRLDGVEPSVAELAAGRYRASTTLQMVTRRAAAPAVAGFLAFVGSPAAGRILAASGHLVQGA
jgi:phosphate transport system substrate-binding protein